jgi:hypothetical protein
MLEQPGLLIEPFQRPQFHLPSEPGVTNGGLQHAYNPVARRGIRARGRGGVREEPAGNESCPRREEEQKGARVTSGLPIPRRAALPGGHRQKPG